jgi:hypothetical protein
VEIWRFFLKSRILAIANLKNSLDSSILKNSFLAMCQQNKGLAASSVFFWSVLCDVARLVTIGRKI